MIGNPDPGSTSRAASEPMSVTSRPSRIHTVPRPTMTFQWIPDQGSRSIRAGTLVSIVFMDRSRFALSPMNRF